MTSQAYAGLPRQSKSYSEEVVVLEQASDIYASKVLSTSSRKMHLTGFQRSPTFPCFRSGHKTLLPHMRPNKLCAGRQHSPHVEDRGRFMTNTPFRPRQHIRACGFLKRWAARATGASGRTGFSSHPAGSSVEAFLPRGVAYHSHLYTRPRGWA